MLKEQARQNILYSEEEVLGSDAGSVDFNGTVGLMGPGVWKAALPPS